MRYEILPHFSSLWNTFSFLLKNTHNFLNGMKNPPKKVESGNIFGKLTKIHTASCPTHSHTDIKVAAGRQLFKSAEHVSKQAIITRVTEIFRFSSAQLFLQLP